MYLLFYVTLVTITLRVHLESYKRQDMVMVDDKRGEVHSRPLAVSRLRLSPHTTVH